MKKVIVALGLVTASAIYGAVALFSMVPQAVGTSVIAEKSKDGTAGGQAAILLPKDLTTTQGRLLSQAYEIAKADGHKNPELVQAILLQETMAGGSKSFRVANPGPDAYFGLMQIKLTSAKDVLRKWPKLFDKYGLQGRTDAEIQANLILNDKFNMEVGSKYLIMLNKEYGYSGRELMNAYNRGPSGVKAVDDSFHYGRGAEAKLASFKSKHR